MKKKIITYSLKFLHILKQYFKNITLPIVKSKTTCGHSITTASRLP